MIAFTKKLPTTSSTWQSEFLKMLPEIESRFRMEFRDLNLSAREEAICEGVAHCLFAYFRLHERRRAHRATAFTLVLYASRHVRRGRPAAGRMNSKEPMSRYAQLAIGIRVDSQASEWIEAIVEDRRAPISEQVAIKMDFCAWFSSLSQRTKRIARDLAFGCTTKEAAKRHGLTPGRISQVRRSLAASWASFQGNQAAAVPC